MTQLWHNRSCIRQTHPRYKVEELVKNNLHLIEFIFKVLPEHGIESVQVLVLKQVQRQVQLDRQLGLVLLQVGHDMLRVGIHDEGRSKRQVHAQEFGQQVLQVLGNIPVVEHNNERMGHMEQSGQVQVHKAQRLR